MPIFIISLKLGIKPIQDKLKTKNLLTGNLKCVRCSHMVFLADVYNKLLVDNCISSENEATIFSIHQMA